MTPMSANRRQEERFGLKAAALMKITQKQLIVNDSKYIYPVNCMT